MQAFSQGPTSNTSAATRTELRDALRCVAAITRGHGARLTVLEERPTPRDTTRVTKWPNCCRQGKGSFMRWKASPARSQRMSHDLHHPVSCRVSTVRSTWAICPQLGSDVSKSACVRQVSDHPEAHGPEPPPENTMVCGRTLTTPTGLHGSGVWIV